MAARLFTQRPTRAISLRQQAEALYAQLKDAHVTRVVSAAPLLRGQHRERKGGGGHDFWQYRDFQTGDTARAIDWKQSGKSDRLLIRQKQQETLRRVSVWLQNDAGMMFGSPPKYDTGAVITLTLAMLCARHHDPHDLCGAGTLSLDALTGVMGDAAYTPDLRAARGSEVFLIGDFIDLPDAIDDLAGADRVHLIQILDRNELDLPYNGRVIFEHPGKTDREQILNVGSIRDAYLQRLHTHLETVRRMAVDRGWTYSLIPSGGDLFTPLLDLMLREDNA